MGIFFDESKPGIGVKGVNEGTELVVFGQK